MTHRELHRRLQVAEAAVAHLSRLQWRKAGRSSGSVGRILMLARIDRLERAMAQAMRHLDDLATDFGEDCPVDVTLAFALLDAALGESDWREELQGWDGKSELPEPAPPVPPGGIVLIDGKKYRLGAPDPEGRIRGIPID